MHYFWTLFLGSALLIASASARFLIYADEWHPTRPTNSEDRAGIDYVVLAFAMANSTASFQPKVPISTIRTEFPNAKVMIAVGGWGDDVGFFQASKTDATIKQWAADIATMLTSTGADGVDIDWEYPGGNGADYKQVPNADKVFEIEAYPKCLSAIRAAIGSKILSIAVPGKKLDMIGFTAETGPKIWPSVDFINVMSYDLMNRRDTITKHHTSVAGSIDTINNYLAIGAPPEKINLGFAYYAKYFTTEGDCSASPLGCPIALAEDPITGKDTLKSGAWTFETYHMKPVDASALTVSNDGTCGPEKGTKCATGCCSQYGNCGTSPEHCSGACQHAFGTGCTDSDVAGSWQTAMKMGMTDQQQGGQYYYDAANKLFWTWDTPALITRKFDEIVKRYNIGGVMAWSLGEDSFDWSHIRQMKAELAKGGNSTPSALGLPPPPPPPPVGSPVILPAPAGVPPLSPSPIGVQQVLPSPVYTPPIAQPPPPPQAPQGPSPPSPPSPPSGPWQPSPPSAPWQPSPPSASGIPPLPQQESGPINGWGPKKPPFDTVWVDGTPTGPEGDHATQPGSPPDFVQPPPQDMNMPMPPSPPAAGIHLPPPIGLTPPSMLAPTPLPANGPVGPFAPLPPIAPLAPIPPIAPKPPVAPRPPIVPNAPAPPFPPSPPSVPGVPAPGDLPFSPAYLAAIAKHGGGRESVVPVATEDESEALGQGRACKLKKRKRRSLGKLKK